MKVRVRSYTFAIILVANTVLFALINIVFPCRFETNDDVTMAWIASGVYTGTPDAHLVYINYLYGALLAFLYRIVPCVEWYTLLFSLIHIFSSSVVVYCLLSVDRFKYRISKLLNVTAFYLIYVYSVLYLEFTTVAVICAIAGLLLISSTRQSILGIVMFVIASLVRFDAAMMVGLVYAFFYPKEIMLRSTSWKKFTGLAVACIVAMGLNLVDKQIYESEENWSQFRAYNEARGIADNPLFRVVEKDENAGISKINLMHALNFTIDESSVSVKQLQEASVNVFDRITVRDRFKVAMAQLMEPKYLYAVVLLFLFFLSVSISEEKRLFFPSFLPFLLVIALMFAIASGAYLKYRVFLGLVLSAFVFASVFCAPIQKGKRSIFGNGLVIGSLVLLSLLWGKREVANFKKEISQAPVGRENLAQFRKEASGYSNTLSFVCVPIENVNPWEVTKKPFMNHVEEMWWMSKWPSHAQLHSHKDILTNEIVLCTLSDGWQDTGEFFAESIRHNYDIETEPHLLFESGGLAGVVLKKKESEE